MSVKPPLLFYVYVCISLADSTFLSYYFVSLEDIQKKNSLWKSLKDKNIKMTLETLNLYHLKVLKCANYMSIYVKILH